MTTLTRTFTPAVSTPESSVTPLAERWQHLKAEQPNVRIRNAACLLGVSEAQLVATQCGRKNAAEDQATRLTCAPYEMLADAHTVGSVMALVRNEHAVHETIGVFGKLAGKGPVRLFLGAQDQRLFAHRWTKAFWVQTPERESVQFFNAQGVACFKIFTRPETDMDAWSRWIAPYVSENQATEESVEPIHNDAKKVILNPQETTELRTRWSQITDVHQFNQLLRDFDVSRLSAVLHAGKEWARPVSPDAIEQALNLAAERHIPIMTFVSNHDIVQIHTGVPQRLLRTGPWFNVLDPQFNLHLNTAGIVQAWVITRPTQDGVVTTLEAFDAYGESILQLFGERHEGEAELENWRALTEELPTFQPTLREVAHA